MEAFDNSDISEKQLNFYKVGSGRIMTINYEPGNMSLKDNNLIKFYDPETGTRVGTLELEEYNPETEHNIYSGFGPSKKALFYEYGFEFKDLDHDRVEINTKKLIEDAFEAMKTEPEVNGNYHMSVTDRDADIGTFNSDFHLEYSKSVDEDGFISNSDIFIWYNENLPGYGHFGRYNIKKSRLDLIELAYYDNSITGGSSTKKDTQNQTIFKEKMGTNNSFVDNPNSFDLNPVIPKEYRKEHLDMLKKYLVENLNN